MTQDYYTWGQFVCAVNDLLTIDAPGGRSGIDAYRTGLIRTAVIKLQNIIPTYRNGHETVYLPQDLVTEGRASLGVKVPGAAVEDAYLCATESRGGSGKVGCVRFPLIPFEWENRFQLINGEIQYGGDYGYIAMDPRGYKFYVWPECFDGWMLSLFWSGLKLDFKDDELTPFDEDMVLAVADFVKGYIAREVERDIPMHDSYIRSYEGAKPLLFANAREKSAIRSTGKTLHLARYEPWLCGRNQGAVKGCFKDTGPLEQQVWQWAGNPNGFVNSVSPAICFDTVNRVTWQKDDGVKSNTGWH